MSTAPRRDRVERPDRVDEHTAPARLVLADMGGSAGPHSLTQPELATTLRDNKLDALEAAQPDLIVIANVGCQTRLNGAGRTPARHWIELADNRLVD